MYGIVLQNFQKRIQNVYKTYGFRIQISYRAGDKCMCIDYRDHNVKTKKNSYTISRQIKIFVSF